jgi:hypothetical protein
MTEIEKKYDKLRQLNDSHVRAIKALEGEVERLMQENQMLRNQIENADQRVWLQKQVVTNSLKQHQATVDNLTAEIKGLKRKLRETANASDD